MILSLLISLVKIFLCFWNWESNRRMVQGEMGCQRGTTLDSSIPCEGNKVKKFLIFKIYQSDFLVFFFPFFSLKILWNSINILDSKTLQKVRTHLKFATLNWVECNGVSQNIAVWLSLLFHFLLEDVLHLSYQGN